MVTFRFEVGSLILTAPPVEAVSYFTSALFENLPRTIPPHFSYQGLTSIGSHAFYLCTSLSSVVLPEGLTSIREYAFAECSSLSSVVLSEGLRSIGNNAIAECSSLTSVKVPGLTRIGL